MLKLSRSEAIKRYLAIQPVMRAFVGGCIDGETRECRTARKEVNGDLYQLVGEVMVFQPSRKDRC